MEIRRFEERDTPAVVDMWNRSCGVDMPYQPFTQERFWQNFLHNPHFCPSGTFTATAGDEIIGFASGLYQKEFLPGETHENTPGYLTFVLVAKAWRKQGIGTKLLRRVEDFFREAGKREVQVIFFNPINLTWIIPGTADHDHPNAPGVDVDGPGYGYLLSQGFAERTREVSMYLDLKNFFLPEKIRSKQMQLNQKAISIEEYDEKRHNGFDELFDNLKHEHWRKDIQDNLAMDKPHPILIVNHEGSIRGFAGPIAVQESGRGWFAGIAVDPGYEGMGIGSVLFARLMESFQAAGAAFSTLFTGQENPARKLYERTGFTVVKTWAVMRKEL